MEEDKKMWICRVCINNIGIIEECYYLFENCKTAVAVDNKLMYEDVTIASKITAIAKVDIEEGDGLPNRICSSCFQELENAFNFKQKCEKSDDILQIAKNKLCYLSQEVNFKEESDHEYINEVYCKDDDDLPSPELQPSDDIVKETLVEHIQHNLNIKLEPVVTSKKQTVTEVISDRDSNKTPAITKTNTNQQVIQPPSSMTLMSNYKNPVKKSKAIDLKLECNECGNFFKSKCKFRVHWKKEHNTFKCTYCKLVFKSYKAFGKHIQNRPKICLNSSKMRFEGEGKSTIIYCNECDYSTKCRANIGNHLIVHSKELPYSCDMCSRVFARLPTLTYHKERMHKKYLKQSTCHVCGLVILGRIQFSEHMQRHNRKQVQCDLCKKYYSSKTSLIDHIKRHNGIKQYSCDKCDSTFCTATQLWGHKQKSHSPKQIYTCKVCGYKLRSRYHIVRHEKQHTPFNMACRVCGLFVGNDTALAMHKKKHEGSHPCDYCNKAYKLRKCLTEHLRKTHNYFVSKGSQCKIEKLKYGINKKIVVKGSSCD